MNLDHISSAVTSRFYIQNMVLFLDSIVGAECSHPTDRAKQDRKIPMHGY